MQAFIFLWAKFELFLSLLQAFQHGFPGTNDQSNGPVQLCRSSPDRSPLPAGHSLTA